MSFTFRRRKRLDRNTSLNLSKRGPSARQRPLVQVQAVKRLGLLVGAVVAMTLLASPANASQRGLRHAEAVVHASSSAAVWHLPHRGYLVQDRAQMSTTRAPRIGVALTHCHGDAVCRSTTRAYYAQLHHQWRTLNRNLWTLAAAFPKCAGSSPDDCVWPQRGAEGLVLDGRSYVAEQRAAFRG